MKTNALSALLEGALVVCVLFSMFMCIRLIVHTRDLRNDNAEIERINTLNQQLQLLVNDCSAYSTRNPAIKPILTSLQTGMAGIHSK